MTVSDWRGEVISTNAITMGSFYAGMSTTVSVMLSGLLEPGDYTVTLVLTDPLTGVAASALDVLVSVAELGLFDQATELLAPLTNLAPPGFTPLLIALIVAGVLGLLLVAVLGIRRLLRRNSPAAPAPVSVPDPVTD